MTLIATAFCVRLSYLNTKVSTECNDVLASNVPLENVAGRALAWLRSTLRICREGVRKHTDPVLLYIKNFWVCLVRVPN